MKQLNTKDYFLTQKEFSIVPFSDGILQTKPMPSKEDLPKYYASDDYFSHGSNNSFLGKWYSKISYWRSKARASQALPKDWHKQQNTIPYRILDIGAGTGNFLSAIPNEIVKTGVEVNQSALSYAQSKNIPKTTFYHSLEEAISYSMEKWNLVTLWHVLEHLYDPELVLSRISQNVVEGGRLVIALPNYDSNDALYYKEKWAAWDTPRHLWHFNERGIVELAKQYGFTHLKTLHSYWDVYYISLLSERYKGNKGWKGYVLALIKASLFNIKSLINNKISAKTYIFER